MSLEYADEKFSQAVYRLATHSGAIKERLAAALLDIGSVQLRDVPEGLHDLYSDFWKSVTRNGDIITSANAMTIDEAVEAAKLIVRFANEFELRLADQRAKNRS